MIQPYCFQGHLFARQQMFLGSQGTGSGPCEGFREEVWLRDGPSALGGVFSLH